MGTGAVGALEPEKELCPCQLLHLRTGMLVLDSLHRLIGGNPVAWLCDQELIKSFQNGPPPEKAKLRRWWTYLSQLRLKVYHIQGIKNENPNFISQNNFDDPIGTSCESLAREAFAQMDVHLDLGMQRLLELLQDLKFERYGKECSHVLSKVQAQLEPVIIGKEQWTKDKRYMYYEDRIILPKDRVPSVMKWSLP